MAEIINLRQVRKAKARAEADAKAETIQAAARIGAVMKALATVHATL